LGQYIDISMTDCVATLNNMAAAATLAGNTKQFPEQSYLNGGSFYDYYQTQDGRYLSIGSLEPQFMSGLAHILDLPILGEKGASFDPADQHVVKRALQEKIQSKTWQEWQVIFADQDVCVEPVLTLDEALDSRLAQERKWAVEVPLAPDSKQTETQLACPIKFSRSQAEYLYIGQHLGAGNW
jgi:crotonobetainyl-CoA:carnitine CoA-transferase CaiB-like acyl-CoA transferase